MKGNIRMDKFDQYKRLLRLGIAGIEIFIETLFFVYVWDEVYRELRVTMFLNKGNWMMIGFYVLYLIVFVYLYGGTKYAYYKKGQLILSQTLGTIIANALMYIQIIMVVGRFPFPTHLSSPLATTNGTSWQRAGGIITFLIPIQESLRKTDSVR